jgi:dTDP-glucose pyrophosphorylase
MKNDKIKVLIPMAGRGKRFTDAGYGVPKPLTDVLGQSMIEAVVKNLHIDGEYIFIIQKQHQEDYVLADTLKQIVAGCTVFEVDSVTEGPACTALLAEEYIDNSPLIIANCDQIIDDFDIEHLIKFSEINNADGVLGAFVSTSNKNSYVKLNEQGYVSEIREKIVISNIATNGLHYWRRGTDFIQSAKEMIQANEKYNGEFYIAPTYNYLIKNSKIILPYFYNLHFPIGTPEDLSRYTLQFNK